MGQNVLSPDLVVEHVEAVSRLVLRLAIQLDLKFPYLTRCCQTHRQSPLLPSFTSTPEVRALSSAGITRPHRCRVGGGALGHPRAGHRPPLKLYMQFSRVQLSQRLTLPRH